MPSERIAKKLFGEPWAITSDWLQKIVAIADRETDISALEAKLGKKLEYAHVATVRGDIAVIPIDGVIFPKANLFSRISGATSLEMLAQDIQTANDNFDVNKIVLHVDSPGGNIIGIDEMYSLIRNSAKPIYAHITGMGASAAYWIIAGAKQISLSPASQVGSIGVVYITKKSNGESDELEIVNSASPRKRLDPETDEGRKAVQTAVDKFAEVFIADVAEGRNTSTDVVKQDFGKGGMLIGEDAVAIGMADKILTFEELMTELSGQSNKNNSFNEVNNMDAMELKEKHPDIYQAVFAEGEKAVTDGNQSQIANLKKEKVDLTAKIEELDNELAAKSTANDEVYKRLKELEKNEAIRKVADEERATAEAKAKITAESITISKKLLEASDIPASLYTKVTSSAESVDTFIDKDNIFNSVGFEESLQAEIDDWSNRLKASSTALSGFGVAPTDSDADMNSVAVDKGVDRLLAHIPNNAV